MLCVIAWGTSFLVSKNLLEKLTPIQLMMLRFVIAWLAIWVIYPKWYFNWREEGQFAVLSLVGNTLYYLAENSALRLTLASNVSILVSAAPIASALCWALYGFLAKRIIDRHDTFLSTRKLMFYGILTTAPLLLFEGGDLAGIGQLKVDDVCGLLYLGLICSALCYLMWNEAIAEIGAMKANLYVYAVPVVTMFASAAFLDEGITWGGVIGVVLVVGGMLLSSLNRRIPDG